MLFAKQLVTQEQSIIQSFSIEHYNLSNIFSSLSKSFNNKLLDLLNELLIVKGVELIAISEEGM